MKRFFMLILMTVITMSVAVFAQEEIDISCDGRYVCITSAEEKTAAVITAAYSGNELKSVKIWEKAKLSLNENRFDIFELLSFEEDRTLKVLVWESIEGLIPLKTAEEFTIKAIDEQLEVVACEDTWVNGGKNADINYGTDTKLCCRYYPNDKLYDRKSYFKFDISYIPKNGIKNIYFQYYVSAAETGYESVVLNLYGLESDSWSEKSLTYDTQPEWGEYIAQTSAMRSNIGMADITDYVTTHFEDGYISFVCEGNTKNRKQQAVASREHETAEYHPKLVFCYEEDAELFTDYPITSYGKGVDPIENAKEMLKASTAEYVYPDIKSEAYDYSEYTHTASARLSTSSTYSKYKTRRLENLTDYTEKENELNIYGGNINDKVADGTGFFTVKKVNGRWTLVDPLGYRFYSMGVTNVRPADFQEAYKEIVDDYNADIKLWANAKREILFENKMNTAGGWSLMFRGFDVNTGKIVDGLKFDVNTIENDNPVPVGCIIPHGVGIQYARPLGGVTGTGVETFKGGVPPVFNPDFEEKCGEIIAEHTVPLQNSPYVIGWWSDNEINDSQRMLDDALLLDPTDECYVYTHAMAWTWLRDRLGSEYVGIWDLNDTLREEFREFVYDRYYQVMSRQFKKYAPNHLYLGNRHFENAIKSKGIFAAAKRYCDALSFNLYKYWTPSIVTEWEQYADIPVIVTEFYSSENTAVGGWIVEKEEDVGSFYENFTLRLLEAPNIIGWHYHSFSRFGGETVCEYLLNSARNINAKSYSLIEYFDERN